MWVLSVGGGMWRTPRQFGCILYIPEFLEFSSTHFIMKNELNGHSLEKVYEEESGNK